MLILPGSPAFSSLLQPICSINCVAPNVVGEFRDSHVRYYRACMNPNSGFEQRCPDFFFFL